MVLVKSDDFFNFMTAVYSQESRKKIVQIVRFFDRRILCVCEEEKARKVQILLCFKHSADTVGGEYLK